MRILLDANILFSAARSDGAVRRLLRLLVEAGHECWADDYVVAEARRNLAVRRGGTLEVLDALLAHVRVSPVQAGAAAPAQVGWLPDKDRPVLAAAIRLRCAALVTGDRTWECWPPTHRLRRDT